MFASMMGREEQVSDDLDPMSTAGYDEPAESTAGGDDSEPDVDDPTAIVADEAEEHDPDPDPDDDEDDPLAPVFGNADDGEADEGLWDESGAIRIVLQEGRLAEVFVRNRWRKRLGSASKFPKTLLRLMRFHQTSIPAGPATAEGLPEFEDLAPGIMLNRESLGRLQERLNKNRDEMERLNQLNPSEIEPDRIVGEPATGQNAGGHVKVRLDPQGNTEEIECSSTWLEKVRTEELCEAIMAAHRQAYARHQPPTVEPGAYTKLSWEAAAVQHQILQLMKRL
ncbi:hypothetical protein CGZ92_11440 [Parenemella sanctibonifatiensis]|uniref:Uncharacterized protein n=1 Tax=Parenemella sanctibonifatiensis TaxID=2016505 RepID=A0A255E351_9ACTN|nr:hypothetical protein CGZ92_11440 [Parenemella sanctibonifatiensis]